MQAVTITQITPLELQTIIESSVNKALLSKTDQSPQRYKSIRWTCDAFDITRATLYNWERAGLINIYNLSGKAFIDIVELENAIAKNLK